MSKKAKRYSQRENTAATAAMDGLDISSPVKIFAQLREEVIHEKRVLRDLGGSRDTWNRAGCQALMLEAQKYFEEKVGV